jgi:hypothetical protein
MVPVSITEFRIAIEDNKQMDKATIANGYAVLVCRQLAKKITKDITRGVTTIIAGNC